MRVRDSSPRSVCLFSSPPAKYEGRGGREEETATMRTCDCGHHLTMVHGHTGFLGLRPLVSTVYGVLSGVPYNSRDAVDTIRMQLDDRSVWKEKSSTSLAGWVLCPWRSTSLHGGKGTALVHYWPLLKQGATSATFAPKIHYHTAFCRAPSASTVPRSRRHDAS
jgi:hypothetical protein